MPQKPNVMVVFDDTEIHVDHYREDPKRAHAPVVKFDPDQPRVPAGNPDGGQWTDGGGGGGGVVNLEAEVDRAIHQLPDVDAVPAKPVHPYGTEREVRAVVPATQAQYEALLDKGDGIDSRLGAAVVELGREETAPPGKPFIVIVPPKGDRAHEKVIEKYGGDWHRISDMVRGSVVVDKASQVPGVFQAIREEMEEQGWRLAAKPEDRMSKPADDTGYRDVVLKMVGPTGLVTELQIQTRAMLFAKIEGHKLYTRIRVLRETAAKTGWSDAAKAEYNDLVAKSSKLYHEAWEASK